MQRFDILSRELNVFGPHFLEASAGTGKTFAIEHLVVRLLLESEDPILLDQMLVVTFTRAAARELKLRIRQNLTAALQQLKAGVVSHDYLLAILEGGPEKVVRSIRRLEDALICFDSAQIFTIHGFCHRALSEFAFEAGSPFQLRDPDEHDHVGLIHQGVGDFLQSGLDQQSYSPGQVSKLLKLHKSNFDQLKRRLISVVSQDKEIERFPCFSDALKNWKEALAPFSSVKKEALLADYELQSSCYKLMTSPRFMQQVEWIGSMLESQECSSEDFDRLLKEKELFLKKMESSNQKVRAKMPDPSALRYPGIFETLRAALLPIVESASDPKQVFLRLATDCRKSCHDLLSRCDAFSPDELINQMQRSLSSKAFVERLRQRYSVAIIDEFQDTDPIQWNIFETLFVGHARSICLVGDPKQSIYAFRNADLYTYLQAAVALGSENRKYLDTNFRSTPTLVAALNRLFSSEQTKGWMELPQLGISLDVMPVKARPGLVSAEDRTRGSIHFFAASGQPSKHSKKWPTEALEEGAFFPFIAQEMLSYKKDGLWSQFAILVKDRFQAERLWEYLKGVQIPSVIRRSGALNESDAFIALQELLEAICTPSDLSRIKKLLAGPLIGWDHEKVRGNFTDIKLREAKEQILFLQEILVQKGFSPFFSEFLASKWDSELSIAEQLLAQDQLDLYCDLQQLSEILAETSWTKKCVKEELLTILTELAKQSIEEESRLKRRSRGEEDAVQILTIHMSKGLEFESVFALGLAWRHPAQNEIVTKIEGREKIVPLDAENQQCRQSLQELDAEKMRQLYVALTRAKKRVYIPLALDVEKSPLQLGQASPIELFFQRAIGPAFDYESVEAFLTQLQITISRIEPSVISAAKKEAVLLDRPPTPISPMPFEPMLSYSSLAKKADIDPIAREVIKDGPKTALNMPLGAETGLSFHGIMEKLFNQGLHFLPQKKKIVDLIERQTAGTPLVEWNGALFLLIWDLLHTPINGFCLSEIPPSQLQQEMEFLFPVEKGMMKGFADLVFEMGGKYYLLDWKTNWLEDYTAEHVHRSMEQNDYFLQASIYADALKRYVKLFDNRPFSQCFGGAIYIYVRGKAIYPFKPPS